IVPPPPASTPFPYTTLFRSDRLEIGNDDRDLFHVGGRRGELGPEIGSRAGLYLSDHGAGAFAGAVTHDQILFLVGVIDQMHAADLLTGAIARLPPFAAGVEGFAGLIDQLKAQ